MQQMDFFTATNKTDPFLTKPDETDGFMMRLNEMRRSIISDFYDPLMPPWRGPEEGPIVVNSSLHLQNIVSLNEKKQIFDKFCVYTV